MNPESRAGAFPEGPFLVHELVAHQASLTPDAVAVVDGERELGYAELDARANQLAHHLRGLGVRPDAMVGVFLPRGLDLAVALLAIWKAGAAYVPLSPEQPRQRLAWLVQDTGVELVLTGAELAEAVRETGARPVVPADDRAAIEAQPVTAPENTVGAAHAAYVIHTSGSTGTPKGVVTTHGGIANRIGWAVRRAGLSAADRMLQKTALTFDAHCWEVFGPLVTGGTVVMAPAGAERDPAALLRAVADHRITVLQVVPSVLRLLVAEPGWEHCGSLRLLFSAGEALHAELAQQVLALAPAPVEIWNTYGPTECSIDVTAHRFDPAQQSGPVPIGRPLDGLRVLVVDQTGRPVAPGVPGELYAGGVGVARGYLGRPDLTAERFVPDPFAKDGSRLYRTGDRVRWREGGILEYLGRIDDQVKINGVRIEPGEIEDALAAHPGVHGAAVTAYTVADGSKRLAAFVRTAHEGVLAELREFLRDRLPTTHLPASIVRLESFPLNSSGKVDRAALPTDRLAEEAAAAEQIAPRTTAERLVAKIWQDLLKVDSVGVHDDFFKLGGSSLQLTRLANQLRTASGREILLRGLFSATTVEAQAQLVSPEQAAAEPVRPVARDGVLPLSFGQQRLWFMDRMNPQSAEYVAGLAVRVPAGTPVADVRRALDTLVARHESLRTRFTVLDGEPRQVIDAPAPLPLRELRLAREQAGAVLAEEFGRGFDLEQGPLVRALLITIEGEPEPVLELVMHHITTDGWSSAVLEREFFELLAAFAEGREPALAPLTLQYADYAVWQRAQLTEEVLTAELAHWKSVLSGSNPVSLPTDRPRAAVRDGRGSVVNFTVPAAVAEALTALGQRHRATPFATLLTAFATLLARQSGQWDLPVGTPVAGRDLPEIEGVVGFFLNSLVLRCALEPELTFRQALERTRDVARESFAHQNLPFERLVEALAPERDLSSTPLYQVAFDLHDESFNGADSRPEDDLVLQEMWGIAHTDLTLYLRRCPDGSMAGNLEYATALFDAATIERLADRFLRVLSAVSADPETALGDIELLAAEELDQVLGTWATAPGAPVDRPAHEVFEAHAAGTPDAVALVADGVELSYAELDARANRLAHHLRELGVGPESAVGVLLDRGVELVTAFLAVWKAGGAYVPMDPSWPAERVTGMAADSAAPAVLTSAAYAERFAAFTGELVRVDLDAEAIAARPATAPGVPGALDRLAYLIYTSGSTGRPKGVAVTHRGLANHLQWAVDELAARGTGGGAVFSSVAFDLVVPNVWAPLMAGQRTVLLPADLDLSELGARLLAAGPFSFLKLTPGHLEILSHQLTPEQAASLAGIVVVAGEALPGKLAAQWAGWLGEGRLVNEYGPTEASVGTCTYPVPLNAGAGVVPIGRPLPNMSMYVLDQAMRPVPTGAVGELYVGGTGVARGYAGRPELTAERFLPDPFGPAGARLYRTGDLARWLADGSVEFLGRIDHQVKIRGYRVEPGEAQAVLATHPGVREAVVVARVEANGEARLVGYFVPADGEVPAAELTEHCARQLPDYLVPSAFSAIGAIPLTANGKLDRAALPAPEAVPVAGGAEPRGPLEERISEIWEELLGTRVGIFDNFFYSGGNSILAIRLIASLQADFDVTLPIRTVFEGPTIAALAEAVEAAVRAEIDRMTDSELFEEHA
ncbi:amino acid adenylation domain-containing protein [Kitasatospora sp. HPMI-4]|uniref:amino acid adenylation domain-containing protein n=1 Tax=Kitasatospora sp. HPMI-4 TaxID=3448443 RepID=UPI003F1C7C0A